jgi:DNA-directed RNA polymerase subunit RPC12/RpoP
MPTIALKVTYASSRDPEDIRPDAAKPIFSGSGDTDYACGGCGAIIAARMAPNQHVILDRAACPACGAENEFPPSLRA